MLVTRDVRGGPKRSRRRRRQSNDPAATKPVERAAKSKHAIATKHSDDLADCESAKFATCNWNRASAAARENESDTTGPSLRLAKRET